MNGTTAAGARVGLLLRDTTSLHLNDAGWALFDAAVIFCVDAS